MTLTKVADLPLKSRLRIGLYRDLAGRRGVVVVVVDRRKVRCPRPEVLFVG